MHFLDSWTRLPAADLLRLLTPAALLSLAVFVPTQWIARASAAGMALMVLFLGELGPRWPVGVGWAALWGVVAWNARPAPPKRARGTPGGAESGVVGLMLGLALLALLLAAVARFDLDPAGSRGTSYGVLLLCLGLLHLMLRRHIRSAMVGFAALGLGLQVMEGAAQASGSTEYPFMPSSWIQFRLKASVECRSRRNRTYPILASFTIVGLKVWVFPKAN